MQEIQRLHRRREYTSSPVPQTEAIRPLQIPLITKIGLGLGIAVTLGGLASIGIGVCILTGVISPFASATLFFIAGAVGTVAGGTCLAANALKIHRLKQIPNIRDLNAFFTLCAHYYRPNTNLANLLTYFNSQDSIRHQATVKVYYNESTMCRHDAKCAVREREPVNLAMRRFYSEDRLEQMLGYRRSVYANGRKRNGELFSAAPNTTAIYSENFLWEHPGSVEGKKEIAILSFPSPPIHERFHPHYRYYIELALIDQEKYRAEMRYLANVIIRAIRNHQRSAFQGQGIRRVVLTPYGQENRSSPLGTGNQTIARRIFCETIEPIRAYCEEEEIELALFTPTGQNELAQSAEQIGISPLEGDFFTSVNAYDLLIHPCTTHAVPGNGWDGNPTLDGVIGRSTTVTLTQFPYLNSRLLSSSRRYIPVSPPSL